MARINNTIKTDLNPIVDFEEQADQILNRLFHDIAEWASQIESIEQSHKPKGMKGAFDDLLM